LVGHHTSRIHTAEFRSHPVTRDLGHPLKRPAHQRTPRLRPVRVGSDEMRKPLENQPFGEVSDLGAEGSDQASGGQLEEAAGVHQRLHDLRLAQYSQIPFGMGEDPDQPYRVQVAQQPVEREVYLVGQLQKHVSVMVRQRDDFARADLPDEIGLDPHIPPRKDSQGNAFPVEEFLELPTGGANGVAVVPRVTAQLVRSCHYGRDPVGGGQSGHGQRLGLIGRTVVDAGQQMTVDVDEGTGVWHGRSDLERRLGRKPKVAKYSDGCLPLEGELWLRECVDPGACGAGRHDLATARPLPGHFAEFHALRSKSKRGGRPRRATKTLADGARLGIPRAFSDKHPTEIDLPGVAMVASRPISRRRRPPGRIRRNQRNRP